MTDVDAIKKLIDELNEARKALKMKLLAEMESEAIRRDLDSFRLTCRGTTFKRINGEIRCVKIARFYQAYCDLISPRGIQLFWEKGHGYV